MSERKLTAGSEEELRFQIMQKGLGGKFNLHLGILLAELDDLRSLRPAPAEPVTNKDPWRAGDRAAECLHCGGTGTAEADGREGECAECGGLGGLDPQGRGVVLDENGDAVPPPKPPAPAERFEEWDTSGMYPVRVPPQAEQAAREGLPPLSDEERAARRPLPPAVTMNALGGTVHQKPPERPPSGGEDDLDSDPQIARARRFDATERLAEAYGAWKEASIVPATRCAVFHGPEGCPDENAWTSRKDHARRALDEAYSAYRAARAKASEGGGEGE